jgi:hypothetical protein
VRNCRAPMATAPSGPQISGLTSSASMYLPSLAASSGTLAMAQATALRSSSRPS